jgi:3-oxoacyl-[acyl-carrier protein] reductase
VIAEIPAGRLGRPEEIAALVIWLAGPENTYISGQNIAIDGGFTRA